jgi:hypothetical protein
MPRWWKMHWPEATSTERREVEDLTGRIPLLLDQFLDGMSSKLPMSTLWETNVRFAKEINRVTANVTMYAQQQHERGTITYQR